MQLPFVKRFFKDSMCCQMTVHLNERKTPTLSIELAPIEDKSVDFVSKIYLQLSEGELNELASYLQKANGNLQAFQIGYHGSSNNKLLKIHYQADGLNVFMVEGGNRKRYMTIPYDRLFEVYTLVLQAIANRDQLTIIQAEQLISRVDAMISRCTNSLPSNQN